MVGQLLLLVREHLLGHHDGPERQLHAERLATLDQPLDVGVGLALGLRVPVAVERLHQRAAALEVEPADLERAPAVQVDRAVVHGGHRALDVDVPDQLARAGVDDHDAVAARRAQRHRRGRELLRVGRARTCRQGARADRPQSTSASANVPPRRPEELGVGRLQRPFVRGAQHVRDVDLLVEGIEDRRLDRPVEELVGMAAEELVERVLARHVQRQPAATPPGTAPHLAQRRDGPRERHADRRVERADVDPELERVGGRRRRAARRRPAAPRSRAAAAACSRRGTARSARRDPPGRAGPVRAARTSPSARRPCATS